MRAALLVLALAACDGGGSAADAGFRCGTETCDPAADFCYAITAGVRAPGCNALPSGCDACDCVLATFGQGACTGALTCAADGGQITVSCMHP